MITSAAGALRSAKNLGRSFASPHTTSTCGYCLANSCAKIGLTSTAMCRPRPLRRRWITPVHAPVPAPSSTTTGSLLSGIAALSWVAIATELDVTAAIPRGSRKNSRKIKVSTTDHHSVLERDCASTDDRMFQLLMTGEPPPGWPAMPHRLGRCLRSG